LREYLIAVVEDDESVLEALESLLESPGYGVLTYRSAEDFISSGRIDHIDCLITDIGLPGINGIELLRVARLSRAKLPVIVITARSEAALPQAALAAGAYRVFHKPLDNAQLLEAIELTRR
jgi:FixJ family two-component response regulator